MIFNIETLTKIMSFHPECGWMLKLFLTIDSNPSIKSAFHFTNKFKIKTNKQIASKRLNFPTKFYFFSFAFQLKLMSPIVIIVQYNYEKTKSDRMEVFEILFYRPYTNVYLCSNVDSLRINLIHTINFEAY